MGVQGFPNSVWTYGLLPLIRPMRAVVRAALRKSLSPAAISGMPACTVDPMHSFVHITLASGEHPLPRTGVANTLNAGQAHAAPRPRDPNCEENPESGTYTQTYGAIIALNWREVGRKFGGAD